MGAKAAFAEFSNPKGRFTDMDSYITVYDIDGVLKAIPIQTKLAQESLGTNVIQLKDSNGKLYNKALIETVKTKGKCWMEYIFFQPGLLERTNRKSLTPKGLAIWSFPPGPISSTAGRVLSKFFHQSGKRLKKL